MHAQGLELGAYVLALRDISCHSDEGCGCADQRCTGDALNPGACVPQHATVESGAGQGSAQALVVGQRSWARLDAPGDVDVFQVALEPGIYDLKSVAYCGSDTDTKVTLRDSNYQALVSSDDGGEGVYGAILAYRVVSNASFFIEVSGYGATIGDYQVEALLAPECHGTGCLCSPGSVWIQGACQTCAAGHYCAGGASLMAPCELGSWDHDGQPASPCQPCAPRAGA